MKTKKTKEQAAAPSPKSRARIGKLKLNKETLNDLNVKDSKEVKGGAASAYWNCCWVAREVYGKDNPRWRLFREWLLGEAPASFRGLYIRHGERFARWIAPHTTLKSVIRVWMDSVIDQKRADACLGVLSAR